MSKPFIVLGDKTDHGGTVVAVSSQTFIDGKPVARLGDKVACPQCKGTFPIAAGDPTLIIDGQPVARHGDKTACGATLIAGQMQVYVDAGGGGGSGNKDGAAARAGGPATAPQAYHDSPFDLTFLIKDEADGGALAGANY